MGNWCGMQKRQEHVLYLMPKDKQIIRLFSIKIRSENLDKRPSDLSN